MARTTIPDEEVEGRDYPEEQGGQNNLFTFHIKIATRTLSVIFVLISISNPATEQSTFRAATNYSKLFVQKADGTTDDTTEAE